MAAAPPQFVQLIAGITREIDGLPVTPDLAERLNALFPPDGPVFGQLEQYCRQGCIDGWLCAREHEGIKFGRPVKPSAETHGYSVDVVEMSDIEGPHHVHPHGEIDMVMPIDAGARFDGTPRGWTVYGPGSAHRPTVRGGKAIVLYLLPEGAIEFTRT